MRRSASWGDQARGETATQWEHRIRAWVGGQLRQPGCRVPDPVWKRVVDNGFLNDLADQGGSRAAKRELLKAARSYQRDFRADRHVAKVRKRRRLSRPTPSREAVTGVVNLLECLSEKELQRAKVISSESVRIAETLRYNGPGRWPTRERPFITEFRNRVLGGQTISQAQAEQLVKSIGAAMFELEFFEEHGIPLLDHTSELTSGLDPNAADAREGLTPRSEVTFRWGTKTLAATLGKRALQVGSSDYPLQPCWRGESWLAAVSSGSVLGWLNRLRILLLDALPWDDVSAVMFVLTGRHPTVVPIYFRLPEYCTGPNHALMRLDFSVQPWISAQTVLEVYRRVQRIVVGPRNRPPEIKSLQFYDFVSGLRHQGHSLLYAMRVWVLMHPEDRKRYPEDDKTSLTRFSNQFRDIQRQVLRPFGRPDRTEGP